jgi:hypothetical protein
MKSFLTFQKWTKINVQKWVGQKVLTDRIFHFSIYMVIVTNVIVNKIFMIVIFYIFFAEKDLGVFSIDNISMVVNENCPKKPNEFVCESCNFITCNKKDFSRHVVTKKHIINTNQCFSIEKPEKTPYQCICGKIYKENSGLWRHKKVCKFYEKNENNTIIKKSDDNNDKLIEYLMKENKEIKEIILEIVKNGITNNTTL